MTTRLALVPLDQGSIIARCVAKHPDDYGAFLERIPLVDARNAPGPGLLVVNGQHLAQVAGKLAAILDRPVVAALLKDRFALAIDASGEGFPIVPSILAQWHDVLDARGIPADRVAYITHNEKAPAAAADWLRETGRQRGIRVLLHHPFLHLQALWVRDDRRAAEGELAARRRYIAAEAPPPGAARFLCLNNKPHAHRMVVAGRILGGDLAAMTLLSLGGATKGVAETELAPFLREARQILPRFGADLDAIEARIDDLPLKVDGDDCENVVLAIPAALYARSSVSIVTETNFVQSGVERFTEKSVKAFAAGQPALLAALPATLRLLRGVGFESFHPYIDESYDVIAKPQDRLAALLAEAERIGRLSDADFAALLRHCRPAAEHNMHHAADALPALMQRRLGELTRALAWMARPDGV